MRDIRISVVVPMFDAKKHIQRCILSIMNQTLEDIEIIVVNDGSRDCSPELVEKLASYDPRVSLYSIGNSGTSAARNYGIKLAKGQYISFIDSDDFIEPDMLEKMYSMAVTEDSDVVVCGYKKVSEDEFVRDYVIESYDNKKIFFENLLSLSAASSIWNKIYRKQIFDNKECLFPSQFRHNEDNATLFKIIFFSKKVTFIESCHYNWRQTINSKCRSISKERLLDSVKVLTDRQNFLHKEKIYKTHEKAFLQSCIVMILVRLSHIEAYGTHDERKSLFNDFFINIKHYGFLNKKNIHTIKKELNFLYWRLLFKLASVNLHHDAVNILATFPRLDVTYCTDNTSPELGELQSIINQVTTLKIKEAYIYGAGSNWDKIKGKLFGSVDILGLIDKKEKGTRTDNNLDDIQITNLDYAFERFKFGDTIIVSSVSFSEQIYRFITAHPKYNLLGLRIIFFCPVAQV